MTFNKDCRHFVFFKFQLKKKKRFISKGKCVLLLDIFNQFFLVQLKKKNRLKYVFLLDVFNQCSLVQLNK